MSEPATTADARRAVLLSIAREGAHAEPDMHGDPVPEARDRMRELAGMLDDESLAELAARANGSPAALAEADAPKKPKEPGFTGDVTDKLGRKLHYVNGKRVARGEFELHQQRQGAAEQPGAQRTAAATEQPTPATPAKPMSAKERKEAARAEVRANLVNYIARPETFDPGKAKELADALQVLTVVELRQHLRSMAVVIPRTKAVQIAAITESLAYAGNRAGWKARRSMMVNPNVPDAGRPELTKAESSALRVYSSGEYERINMALRGQAAMTPELQDIHDNMQSAFAKAAPLPSPITVRRTVFLPDADIPGFVEKLKQSAASGEPLKLPGYTSTSAVGDGKMPDAFARGDIEYTITATRGLDMRPHARLKRENEFLLDHGSQFRVKSVEQRDGKWHVEMEQVA